MPFAAVDPEAAELTTGNLIAGFMVFATAIGMPYETIAWHWALFFVVLLVGFSLFAFGTIGGGALEHEVIKTLVMEVDIRRQLLVLMHGDREVSTKRLARELGVKRVSPCDPISAEKYTGYIVGGISPFGTRKSFPVCVESSIMMLDRIFVNGGKQGFMVEIDPHDLQKMLLLKEVNVAL